MTCGHRQAEPVTLSTGEQVACICVSCYQQLGANYIDDQRRRAEIVAYCTHDNIVEVTKFGEWEREYTCVTCGIWFKEGEADTPCNSQLGS